MSNNLAIGIDLGTTYTCAGVYSDGKVNIIVNSEGNRTMPSCIAFTDVERLCGERAKEQLCLNPINTIYGKSIEYLSVIHNQLQYFRFFQIPNE